MSAKIQVLLGSKICVTITEQSNKNSEGWILLFNLLVKNGQLYLYPLPHPHHHSASLFNLLQSWLPTWRDIKVKNLDTLVGLRLRLEGGGA